MTKVGVAGKGMSSMWKGFAYPARLSRGRDGRHTVRFADLPEALTDGATEREAREEAADCLNEAIAARLRDGEEIPFPSDRLLSSGRRWWPVAVAPELALKVALRRALRESRRKVADLARLMAIDHKEARRMLDPREATKLPRLARALDLLGYGISVSVFDRRRRNVAYRPVPSRATRARAVA